MGISFGSPNWIGPIWRSDLIWSDLAVRSDPFLFLESLCISMCNWSIINIFMCNLSSLWGHVLIITNPIMSSSSSFILKKQVHFKEGEPYWFLSTTYHPTKIKPRMVCCQEGGDDDGMTHSD